MNLFAALVRQGDTVLEVGAHIGYVSLHLAHLVGTNGRLVVFEPAPGQSKVPPQDRRQFSGQVCVIVEKAATDYTGTARMHVEELTGQNNSLLEDYAVLAENEKLAFAGRVARKVVEVPCTKVDDFLEKERLPVPSFVKIDVEGAEHAVLPRHAADVTRAPESPSMVEVTEKQKEVFALLRGYDFKLYSPDKRSIDHPSELQGNVFVVRTQDPRIACFTSPFE